MLKGKVQHLRFHFSIQHSAFVKTAAVGQTIVVRSSRKRAKEEGKSELRRAVRRVTPGRGNPKDSGTENTPPTCRV